MVFAFRRISKIQAQSTQIRAGFCRICPNNCRKPTFSYFPRKDLAVVNPLLIPSRTWVSLKRDCLILCFGVLGPLLMESQAADPGANVASPQVPRRTAVSPTTRNGVSQTAPNATPAPVPVKRGKLVLVPPGTIVGKTAPKGWSHLILKSYPRIATEDRNLVSPSTYQLASLVFTSIMARVETIPGSNPPRFALGDIGLGLGTKVRGQEMVLSPETQARLGANLGLQERIVLSECYKRQAMARSIVRTDTMAVFDTHAVIDHNGRHRLSRMRYAVLLDPRSGQIATLSWGVDLDQQQQPRVACTDLEWLPPNKVDDCVLYVDPNQFTLGIPNDIAFAVNRPPKGQAQIPLTQDLATLAGRPSYTAQTAHSLEINLRNELRRILEQAARRDSSSRVAAGSAGR